VATLEQLAGFLGAELIGDDAEIARVDSAAQADALALVFAENDAALAVALASGAGAVLARQSVASAGKPILIVRNPRLAFARAAKYLSEKDDRSGNGPQIHATAVLGEEVQLGAGVEIGPHAVIGNRAVLGSNVHIGAGCVIGDGVVIGAGSKLYPRVTVYSGTTMGEHVVVHAGTVLGADGFGYIRNPETGAYTQFPQQGTLVLEDGVEVGANSTIDRGALEETRIGQGTKIDNLVHVGPQRNCGERRCHRGADRHLRQLDHWGQRHRGRTGWHRRSCDGRAWRSTGFGFRRAQPQEGGRARRGVLGKAGTATAPVSERAGHAVEAGAPLWVRHGAGRELAEVLRRLRSLAS
jgi:UDP-3-O-[3-hydroxymyristoyl] glucosamine N-acyltransferase